MSERGNVLADWRFEANEWNVFVEFEEGARGRLIGEILRDNIFWVSFVIALSMIFCGIPAGLLRPLEPERTAGFR